MTFVSKCCKGETCFCGQPAAHKVEETIFPDDPHQRRHPLTAYVCEKHFAQIMGPWGASLARFSEAAHEGSRLLREAKESLSKKDKEKENGAGSKHGVRVPR